MSLISHFVAQSERLVTVEREQHITTTSTIISDYAQQRLRHKIVWYFLLNV